MTSTNSNTLPIKIKILAGSLYVDGLTLAKVSGILPSLSHPLPNPGTGDLIRDYLLQALGSGEAVGLRVYKNFGRLSPRDWYDSRGDITKATPQVIKAVDGYGTIRDGKTVYVGATNKSGANIYSNIYLLSVSQLGDDDINTIFTNLLNDWQFNTNLADPEQLALQRDLVRLNDLATLKNLFVSYSTENNGSVPKLEAGSFLKGQSVSTWPSWQSALGNDLGRALPSDPLNKYNLKQTQRCLLPKFDQTTCWNNIDQIYECPDGSHVYGYKVGDLNSYQLTMNFETKSVTWVGEGSADSISVGASDTCGSYTANGLVQQVNTATE